MWFQLVRWTIDFEMDSKRFIATKPDEGPKSIDGTMIYISSSWKVRTLDKTTGPAFVEGSDPVSASFQPVQAVT